MYHLRPTPPFEQSTKGPQSPVSHWNLPLTVWQPVLGQILPAVQSLIRNNNSSPSQFILFY